ncbi:hypothetical protein [Blastococcus sp. TBT05-19]|uniref:hypothetical protein n=1 Tax=Blastococcus sp. TBT05-19 TaxID=2250581 RepID=UPI0011BDD89B|nr:hypothetical protein [Blastococcus sp. TBT05-19]
MNTPITAADPRYVDPAEWRQVVAAWGAGGLLNALEELSKRSGDRTPPAVLDAGMALRRLLVDVGLDDGRAPLAADAWRDEP